MFDGIGRCSVSPDGDAKDFGEHTADRDAVADDSDGAVRVIRGDLSERFGRSARHLCIGLRAVQARSGPVQI